MAALNELLRQLAPRQPDLSLREFVTQAWHIVEPKTPFVPNWHIDAICEHLQAVSAGQIADLIINIPPRFLKSTLVSVLWPAWVWTWWPESRWLSASYALQLATRDTVKSRRVMQGPWYQERWGKGWAFAGDQNVKSRYENTRTGHRIATSVDSAVTGEGGDLIICDDPVSAREAVSETKREGANDWWDGTMSTRLNDQRTGHRVLIMQRLHEQDLTGHLLAQGGWEHLMLPAEFEPERKCFTGIGWEDPRTEPGELLCPARMGIEETAKLKLVLGSYGTSGQLQQRPSPDEGGILKRHWWQFYDEQPARFDELIQSWDMAFKDTAHSARVSGQVWGRFGADFYALDNYTEKMDFPATQRAVRSLSDKWPQARAKLVEDKANGPAIIASLKREIPGLIAVNPHGTKEARAHAISPTVESGNVWLPSAACGGAAWVDEFVEECASFPNGTYADQVDAFTQAMDRLLGAKKVLAVVPFSLTGASKWR